VDIPRGDLDVGRVLHKPAFKNMKIDGKGPDGTLSAHNVGSLNFWIGEHPYVNNCARLDTYSSWVLLQYAGRKAWERCYIHSLNAERISDIDNYREDASMSK
jgi:hypothetical protein